MTLTGAIKELHELRCAEDMPIYYKPVIAEVINILLTDTQEVKHGRWIESKDGHGCECSECGTAYRWSETDTMRYCKMCGARMDLIGEDKSHPFAESVIMGMDGGEE